MRLVCVCLLMSLLAGCAGQKPEPKDQDAKAKETYSKFFESKSSTENNAAQGLQFSAKYYDAVDKWVAINGKPPYLFGFIYIDAEAGFTLHLDGRKFVATDNGLKNISPDADSVNMFKVRLDNSVSDVAILSDEQIKQLGLPKVPDWLKYYKPGDENTRLSENAYLVGVGFSYNHIGMSHRAIEPLLKVYSKEPHFKGAEFELAYAYNATDDYGKAIEILDKAIINDPKNFLYYKELVFALMAQGKPDEAEKACLQGLELETKKELKAEIAFHVAQSYFQAKNKPKFEKWAKLSKEYADKDSRIYKYLNHFEENWAE